MKLQSVFNRRNKILLKELVVTDFKLRYQGSAIGYLWSVLKPLFLFSVLYIVFDKFLKLGKGVEHYPVYLLTGVVMWSFFTEATTQGLSSIVKRGSLIRKINFPKYIIVISGTISALINLAINMGVIFIFVIFNGVELTPQALLVIPLVVELYIFALALAFLLAALNTKYRDVGYLWEIILQAGFYAVPIIYPIQRVLGSGFDHLVGYILVNPVAQVVQDARYVFITHDSITIQQLFPDWRAFLPFIIIVIFAVLGALYFRKNSKYFAEQI